VEGQVFADRPEWVRGVKLQFESLGRPDYWFTGVATVETDAEGKFVVPRIAVGHVAIGDFLDKRLPVRPLLPRALSEVVAGETTTLRIDLVPGVLARGRVQTAESRKPVAGAHVSTTYGNLRQTEEAETDAEGRFEVRVVPGPAQVAVLLAGRGDPPFMQGRAEPITIPDAVEKFDLPAIQMVKTVRYEGQLIDNAGKSVVGAWVFGSDGRRVGRTTTDGDGKFSVLLPADHESFSALVNGVRYAAALEKTDPLVLKLPVAIK
jgi:hypothetical protein